MSDDEIDRLRAGYEAAKKSQRGAEAAYEKAEAEIERLRAALREIADTDHDIDFPYETQGIAREALSDE